MICEQEIESFILPLPGELGRIQTIVEPLLHAAGFELVWISASKNNLGLFVDRCGEASITVDDLSEVSRLLGDVLDVESAEVPLLSKEYNLEVSSPGLDRPLSKKSHFSQAVDHQVQIRCAPGTIVGVARLTGKLMSVGDDGICVLSLEGKEHKIAWGSINSAHRIWSPARVGKPRTKK